MYKYNSTDVTIRLSEKLIFDCDWNIFLPTVSCIRCRTLYLSPRRIECNLEHVHTFASNCTRRETPSSRISSRGPTRDDRPTASRLRWDILQFPSRVMPSHGFLRRRKWRCAILSCISDIGKSFWPKYIHYFREENGSTLSIRRIGSHTHTCIIRKFRRSRPPWANKQSSQSLVSLGAVPRELVRDKGANKSQTTMPFLACSFRTSVFATYNTLTDDYDDSLLIVCTFASNEWCDVIAWRDLWFLLLAQIESNKDITLKQIYL